MRDTIVINVEGCARCGKNHKEVRFKKFTNPPPDAQYYAECPEPPHEPILLRVDVSGV